MSNRAERPNRLYRWFDADGTLLYVGITGAPIQRVNEHFRSSRWIDFAVRMEIGPVLGDEAAALLAERQAIMSEMPVFNRNGVDGPFVAEQTYLQQRGASHLFRPPARPSGRKTAARPWISAGQVRARMGGLSVKDLVAIPADDLRCYFTPGGRRRYLASEVAAYVSSLRTAELGHSGP